MHRFLAVRQVNNFLCIVYSLGFRNDAPIRNDIINIFGAYRTGKAEIVDLNGGGPLCKHARTLFAEIAV